jgi:mannobiose 2-epimerase
MGRPFPGALFSIMKKELAQYKQEAERELQSILDYWMKHTVDDVNGGFVGKINHNDTVYPEAPKGSVLNSRILWSFSAAYNLTGNREYLPFAERAFRYLLDHFLDNEYGGVYWTVDHKGAPLDTKKQIYALSFAIYGLSEYNLATGDEAAKAAAIQLYLDIVAHSYDHQFGGYIEALARDWKELSDLRLSAKDANERKSMNTHLHVLEGFANLYRIWPDEGLKEKIRDLIRLFLDRIISAETHHLILFFDDEWNRKSNIISYGHDIEAAWLVQEAAEVIGDEGLLHEVKARSIRVANAAAEGLDSDGGLWYEYDGDEQHLIKQKHWWPQAEAMVGFFNAWQIGGDENHLQHSLHSWKFVQQTILDKKRGEWVWGVQEEYSLMTGEDKVGVWKCPYHNSRACIEIIRRILTHSEATVPANKNETNSNN